MPIKTIVSLIMVVSMALWVLLPARFDVVAPRLGMPAIVTAGTTIDIKINSSLPFWQPQWQVSLTLRDQSLPLEIARKEMNFNKQTLSVAIPESVATASYALVVSDGEQKIIRPKAVHVLSEFPSQVSIVQMADLPTLGRGDGDQRLQQIIDEINIINPNLVLMTGDIAYGGTWDQYYRLLAAMEKIQAPVIAAPGNHEYEGWAGFLTLLGEPYHSVDYGKYKIVSLNSGHGRDQLTESQFDWMENQLRELDGRIPIIQLHHPMHHRPDLRGYVAKHVTDMVGYFKKSRVPIVLSGHWHGDAVYDQNGRDRRDAWDFPGTPYVVTTAAGADLREKYSSSPLHHGYRLIRLNEGKLVSYTYDMDGDGERDATSSIPMGKLKSEQQDSRTILVSNELNESFPNARVRIRSTDEDLSLVPDQGTLAGVFNSAGHSIYDIEFPLAANSQLTIQLISKSPGL